MPDIIMDPSAEKQIQINEYRGVAIKGYPTLWKKIIKEWESTGSEDRTWLMYSANYLFCTKGVRWAIDPLGLNWRIHQAPVLQVAEALRNLDFILLTHRHRDHLDFDLLRSLRNFPILWVIPEAILPLVQNEVGLPTKKILVPEQDKPIELEGIRINPFNGLHWENIPNNTEGRRGVPATGYLVECGSKRWLFPGDTRTYDPASMPGFDPVDVLFIHLWLGRNSALMNPPPLVEAFCRFCLAMLPKRILVTHLEDFARDPDEFWENRHFKLVQDWLKENIPDTSVASARMGDLIEL